jgi:hypothetical protein
MTGILSPVGILVGGNLLNPYPDNKYFFAFAIDKKNQDWERVKNEIYRVAKEGFPKLFNADGACLSPKFAFKIVDGDSQLPNSKGVAPCEKSGYPGHWVLNFGGMFPPKVFTKGGASMVSDADLIQRGAKIRVNFSVKSNGSTQQPGVYLNARLVEYIDPGVPLKSMGLQDDGSIFQKNPVDANGLEEFPF